MYKWTEDSVASDFDEDDFEDFDEDLADTYVGKYILVGVTYLDSFGRELERLQMHGVVEAVAADGMHIALRGLHQGETWIMPPTLESVVEAEPGTYTLNSTGELIDDPDLISTWRVTKPCLH
jgi:hypothetical protein